jgi:hypothetical protein
MTLMSSCPVARRFESRYYGDMAVKDLEMLDARYSICHILFNNLFLNNRLATAT